MDTRDTPEQAELRRAARQLARELGPATVADLDDGTRPKRLAAAVHDAGWLELRDDDGAGRPLASGVEAAIVADALGAAVADVAFSGPIVAAEIARRAGVPRDDDAVAAFDDALLAPLIVADGAPARTAAVIDVAPESDTAYVLVTRSDGFRLATIPIDAARTGTDLTRTTRRTTVDAPATLVPNTHPLDDDDLAAVTALGLALTSADLVGVMRGVLDITVEYAADRKQYGVPVGSFQAVQHLLADARCLMEGSLSVAQHASWAVDSLPPAEARTAGRVAKAYCARAARTVCETAIQVHGGIGNTWECMAHVYLRRALTSCQWFGDDGEQLLQLERARLGTG